MRNLFLLLMAITFMSSCGLKFKEETSVTQQSTSLSNAGISVRLNKNELFIEGKKHLAELGINKVSDLTKNIEARFSKIEFSPGATLITDGANVAFITKEIKFNKSTIATYDDGLEDAPLGEQGKQGGEIRIFAHTASGQLTVKLRGQNGGEGIPATEHALPAAKGNTGRAAYCLIGMSACVPGEQGGAGKDGGAGYPGNPGGNGGDAGDFLIVIQQRGDFSMKTQFLPGNGGEGSKGGSGQLGGDGGEGGPSLNIGDGQIKGGSSGPRGKNGPAGTGGVKGSHGQFGKTCIQYQTLDRRECRFGDAQEINGAPQ